MESTKLSILRAPQEYSVRQYEDEFSASPYRTEFDRDRDRILYCRAFRRLKGKTQVFLSAGADHVRTRLTHTLEVSQISRIVSSNLQLDGNLTEAIALGHDLGHTPFGHVGERTLNEIMNNCETLGAFQDFMEDTDKGFKHNWQALRVVCDLERIYGKPGLNLSNFTLWGLLNHSKLQWKGCLYQKKNDGEIDCYLHRNPGTCSNNNIGLLGLGFYSKYIPFLQLTNGSKAWSFEGYIVALADEIAQRHHDMEDALTMGIIEKQELLDQLESNFKYFYSGNSINDTMNRKILRKLRESKINSEFLSYLSKFIVNFYTNLLIETSKKNLSKYIQVTGFHRRRDFVYHFPYLQEEEVNAVIGYPEGFLNNDKKLQTFLKNRILNSYVAQQMDGKGRYVIIRLFKAYLTNPRQLYDPTILAVFRNNGRSFTSEEEHDKQVVGKLRDEIDAVKNKSDLDFQISLLRAICDNISGMTDEFALNQYHNLYG